MVIISKVKSDKGDDWNTGTYEEIVEKYHHENVSDYPVPVKDLTELGKMTEDGYYLGGRDIVAGLQEDTFKCSVEGTKMRISRWMMLKN